MSQIKSKDRVRDYGEVLTPDFIVNDMLSLVKNETERIDSRFLEPACGDGNFLIKVLERKLEVVEKKYKKSQFDYEKNLLTAVSSIYGVDLLNDNIELAQARLYEYCVDEYRKLYKNKINEEVLKNIKYLLNRNILQGDALTLRDDTGNLITFSEWSMASGSKIKRRDFQFLDLAEFELNISSLFSNKEESDTGKSVFLPQPIKEYDAINFLKLYKSHEQSS